MKKSEKTDRVKRKIINALEGREIINIKIRKNPYKNGSYEIQIGDTQNMDLVDSKGSTGLHGFDMKSVLKEIADEMEGLK